MAGEVSYTPSEKDYVAAQRDWWRLFVRRRGARIALACVIAFMAIGLLDAVLDRNSGPTGTALAWNAVSYGLIGLIWSGVALATIRLYLPFSARRLYRQQKTLHQSFRYGWSEEGISVHSRNGAEASRGKIFTIGAWGEAASFSSSMNGFSTSYRAAC